jgi:hypothetical protein
MKNDKAREERIITLAMADGMQNRAQLDQNIYMSRRQYYDACLASFDQGVAAQVTKLPRWAVLGILSSVIPWALLLATVLA